MSRPKDLKLAGSIAILKKMDLSTRVNVHHNGPTYTEKSIESDTIVFLNSSFTRLNSKFRYPKE